MIDTIVIFVLVFLFIAVVGLSISLHRSRENEKTERAKVKELQNLAETDAGYSNLIAKKNLELQKINTEIEDRASIREGLTVDIVYLKNEQETLSTTIETLKKAQKTIEEQLQSYKDNQKELKEHLDEQLFEDLQKLYKVYEEKIESLENQLNDLREKRNAAIMYAVQDYEKDSKIEFYKLQLTTQQLSDIQILRTIENQLNNKEVLNKLIYKVYFEKPYTDLIGRVVGKDKVTGIYKITNLQNQMCYVGQAVDIAKRWQQHIKRALGAEPLTNNKLYPAMQEFGVENFSFEIIDQCDKSKLGEREKYWQEFYGAKIFGYSIK